MARIVKREIYWDDMGAEYVKYRLYVEMAPAQPSYDSPYIEVDAPKTTIVVPDEALGLFDTEGTYNFAVSGFDATGNESDLSGVVSSPFDFTAPAAPTGLGVRTL